MGVEEKIYRVPDIGEVVVRKSVRARRLSIRIHPDKGVVVTLPCGVPYPVGLAFLRMKIRWVREVVERQKAVMENVRIPDRDEVEELRKKAHAVLKPRIAVLAEKYGFCYRRIAIKHNSSNWGSCSTLGNINLNLNLVRLPEALRDYVLLHELCHLRHHDHGAEFHALLERLCGDNLECLAGAGDGLAAELLARTERSKAKFPVHYIMTGEIRKYRLY